MQIKCEWKEPKLLRDAAEPEWQPGVLLQFVCDPGGFIHGLIMTDAGTIVRVHYDLIHVTA